MDKKEKRRVANRAYVKGHISDICQNRHDFTKLTDRVLSLHGQFGNTGEMAKAVKGILIDYVDEKVSNSQLDAVCRKIAFRLIC